MSRAARPRWWALLGAVPALVVLGCAQTGAAGGPGGAPGGTAGAATSGPAPATSALTAAESTDAGPALGLQVGQQLRFAGVLQGEWTSARVGAHYACGASGEPRRYVVSDLVGTLADRQWSLQVSIDGYDGPGPAARAAVVLTEVGGSARYSSAVRGRTKVTIAEDARSGILDVLAYAGAPTTHGVQITGTFHCA